MDKYNYMTPSLPGDGNAFAGTPGKFSFIKSSHTPRVLEDINELDFSIHCD